MSIIGIIAPYELSLYLGSIRLPPHRIAILLFVLPALFRLITQRQLRAMMQQQTDYTIPCEHSVIVLPQSATTLFDFSDPATTIEDGYKATMARMPEIKAMIAKYRTAER